ncbi:MAG: GIY-YIG nuclease family protein, partial [Bacillota bacterium]|nr:GIY-YIG nuclease family protein [Bacillota bacterium]
TENHKIFIGSTRNVKTLNGVKFSLDTGTNYNKKLQKEWTEYGKDVFEFTVLEKLKVNEDIKYYNEKEELEKLESKWLNEYQPYGDRGYN